VQVVHPLKPELTHWQRGAVTWNILTPTSAPFAGCVASSPAKEKCRSGAKSGMPCTTAT
jgi:hypothetical protein